MKTFKHLFTSICLLIFLGACEGGDANDGGSGLVVITQRLDCTYPMDDLTFNVAYTYSYYEITGAIFQDTAVCEATEADGTTVAADEALLGTCYLDIDEFRYMIEVGDQSITITKSEAGEVITSDFIDDCTITDL